VLNSIISRGEHQVSVWEQGAEGIFISLREMVEIGENFIMKTFIMCTRKWTLLGMAQRRKGIRYVAYMG
jgi:hypothetical protein